MGVSRERENQQRAKEDAVASKARICMRARARRLVVLLVSIKTPFRASVERWNDSRTLCSHTGEYQYDDGEHAWVAEEGESEVLVGSSSQDIRATAMFTLGGDESFWWVSRKSRFLIG